MITLLVKSNKQLSMTKQTANVYSGESQFDNFKIMMSKTIGDKNTRDLITEFHLVYPNDEQDIVNIDFTEEDEKYLITYLPIKKEYTQDLGSHFIYFKWLNTDGVVGVTNADLFIIKKHIDTAGVSEHQINILSEYSVKFAQWADSAKKDANKAKTYYTELIDHSGKLAPYIGENENWFIYDSVTDSHIDSGISARGEGTYDYNDLENKPTIPEKTSDLINDSNFVSDENYIHTDNNYTNEEKIKLSTLENNEKIKIDIQQLQNDLGQLNKHLDSKYEKPAGGIPEQDLSEEVQEKLNKSQAEDEIYYGDTPPENEKIKTWVDTSEQESSNVITKVIDEDSTDEQLPTAKAVYNRTAILKNPIEVTLTDFQVPDEIKEQIDNNIQNLTGLKTDFEDALVKIENLNNNKIDLPEREGTTGQVLGLDEDGQTEWVDQQGGSIKEWKKVAQVVLEEAVQIATISLDDYNSYDECVIYITQAGGSTTATQIYAYAWANSIIINPGLGFYIGNTGTTTLNQQSCMRFSRLSDNKVLLNFCGNTRGGNTAASFGNNANVSCRLINNYGNRFGFSVGNGQTLPVGFAFDVYVR